MQVVVTSSFSSSCGIENKKQMITKIYFCFSLVRFWLTYYLSGQFSAFYVRSLSSPTVVIFPRLFTTEFMEVCSVIGFALMQGVWYLLDQSLRSRTCNAWHYRPPLCSGDLPQWVLCVSLPPNSDVYGMFICPELIFPDPTYYIVWKFIIYVFIEAVGSSVQFVFNCCVSNWMSIRYTSH